MRSLVRIYHSTVGMKSIMAITGLLLFGFVLAHMLGNFIAYTGRDNFNAYAHSMQSMGGLLWAARAGLLAIFVLHIFTAFRVTLLSRAARPEAYVCKKPVDASFASRTMMMSGLIVLVFILYHLAHFTFHVVGGDIHGQLDELGRHDAYYMFVMGLGNPVSAVIYIIGNILLGLHLSHGLQSLLLSLGVNHPQYRGVLSTTGFAAAWAVAIGNVSMPLAVLAGIISI